MSELLDIIQREYTKQVFNKRQVELLWIANTKVGKKLLKIENDLLIVRLTPNSIHQLLGIKNGQEEIVADFYTNDRIADILLTVLEKMDLAGDRNWKVFRNIQENSYKAFLHYANVSRSNFPDV